ncbi:MAG: DNA primase [Candidatus Pacebacteria bacterium RIFCSPHIGHO2_02_FULL_46_9]|nr:MAG: DNA primase [Candidatus Pacebacteria bacterium RIFCSPHIGHO2_02_FULL_46_9]
MSQIQSIKEATDIVAVVGARVQLQGAGAQFKGVCPFHAERSPSFFVSPILQRYKCFGCGEAGDVFDFLQKYEGLSFQETLEELAEAAGIELEQYQASAVDQLRNNILATLASAQQYYHYLLVEHAVGKPAREYLRSRGVTKDTIRQFSLGASTPGWDGLIAYLHEKKKVDLKLLEQAGLAISNRGRTYDRFRNRVIFPLTTHRGQVVGFSGRSLPGEDDRGVKYINSPETMVYHKSELLFGFSQLHSEIRAASSIIIVEGEFDVLASVQAHQNNVSAIKGSALTQTHVRLLRRSVKQVILALDTDAAGRAATKKAIVIIKQDQAEGENPLELRVATLVQGKDPADLVAQDPGLWRTAIKQSVTAYDFLITTALNQYDPDSPSGKRQIMQDLVPVLQHVTHAVEREHYVQRLGKALGVSLASIMSDLSTTGPRKTATQPEKKTGQTSSSDSQELRILSVFIHSPQDKLAERAQELQQFSWQTTGTLEILEIIRQHPGASVAVIDRLLASDLQAVLTQWYLSDAVNKNSELVVSERDWSQLVARLKKQQAEQELTELSHQLEAFDNQATLTPADEVKQRALLERVVQLQRLT